MARPSYHRLAPQAFALVATLTFVAGAAKPIPQDTARIEKRRKDREEWTRRSFQGQYDRVGKKDPRWDKLAHEAMDLSVRRAEREPGVTITAEQLAGAAKAAVDAGCDDPLILHLYDRASLNSSHPGAGEMLRRVRASSKALAASRYPAFRRAGALELAGTSLLTLSEPDDASRKEAEADFDAALALFPVSFAEDERGEFWEERWFDTFTRLIAGYRKLGLDAPDAYERVDAGMARVPEMEALRLLVRGAFWIDYGWEARTDAVAALVPPGGFEKLEARLKIARKALNQSWDLRPSAKAANYLITIDKGTVGDRDAMEFWFERAMKADGDFYAACVNKLDWLHPKWHGTFEEMVAFGRACRDTRNWRAGITLLAAKAHFECYSRLEPKERAEYMKSPEVWADISSVYDEYLEHYPGNDVARSKYAVLCYLCRHYPEAHAQFQALGDRLTEWADRPNYPLATLQKFRDQTARIVAARQGGWRGFFARNDEGEWAVNVPTKPERKQESGILGAKWRNVFASTADGITYTVRVQPVPADAKAKGAEAVLDAARDAIAKERGGRVLDEHPVVLAGVPGREYLVEAQPPSAVRIRAAVIGEKLYELSVSASKEEVSGAMAGFFLDSFRFKR
jgi:hypothetical protein